MNAVNVLSLCFLLLVCVRCYPVDDEAGLPGAMRGYSPGLVVLKGYLLGVGHLFPSFPYTTYPWTSADLNAFLTTHYDALNAGSTEAIEDRFVEDALMLLDVRTDDDVLEDSKTIGKSKIVSKASEWISNRGAVTSPIVWNVLSYRHPMVVVEGHATFETQGLCSFVQSFVFRGSKVGMTGQVIHIGAVPSPVVPTALTDLLNDLYEGLDNKETAVAESNFPKDYTSVLVHRYPKGDGTFHLFSKDLEGFVKMSNIYFVARGLQPTKTTWTVVKYLYPKIWVEVTVEQPVGSVLSTALMGYKLDDVKGKFQLLGDLSVVDFPNTTLLEFFLSLNR
eukprot:GHVS01095059.1.p1 GENE.GHVS01095059.1~~GHVS01095059.1.p1  ORF type:complete len:335 (+),score=32.03 GHVS01095059.1:80-1084(+)